MASFSLLAGRARTCSGGEVEAAGGVVVAYLFPRSERHASSQRATRPFAPEGIPDTPVSAARLPSLLTRNALIVPAPALSEYRYRSSRERARSIGAAAVTPVMPFAS